MAEKLREYSDTKVDSPDSSGNGDSRLEQLKAKFSQGTSVEDCVQNLWLDHLRSRGEFPIDELKSTLNSFIDFLPQDLQADLTLPIPGDRAQRTLLIMIAEEARKEVEKEKKLAVVKRDKPSREMAKHIRRVKSAQRRSGVLPKS